MRLTLATLLLIASSPAWAGDVLVSDSPVPPETVLPPAGRPDAVSSQNAVLRVPAPPRAQDPYAAIDDAPLFGNAGPAVEKVDETALRFYAGQKNRTRVDAEIKRLHGLHPAWKVPANLYASGTGDDEQPLWDLFSAGRTEELRQTIQAREKREAGWRPSADLLAKMARAENAAQIKLLSDAKDWTRLLAVAVAHPDTLSCATVDLDWRVAEAFAAVGSPERAYEVDAAILKSCKNRDERLATVRKAVDLLRSADVDRLIAAGAVLADGSGEFDDVRLDLARRQISAVLSMPATDDRKNVGEVVASSLDALGTAALRSGDTSDAALLGWYDYHHGRWAEADGWFKLGLQGSSGDSKMAEGHALALRELGRVDEAEQLAHAWRERSGVMRALFVTLMTARLGSADASSVDPAEMADFSAILLAERSVAAAGALGWTAYGRGDFDAAALWFGRAVDWSGSGDLPDKVVEGYGLTLQRLGRFDAAEDFLYGRRDRSTTARDLYVAVAVSALSGGAKPGTVGPNLPVAAVLPERMDRYVEVIRAARSAPGAAALGWRELRDSRPAAAVDRFRDAVAWSPGGTADLPIVEGLTLALKDAGRLTEAEDAAYAHIRDSAQLREAYRDIMVTQLATPSLAGRLTPERVLRFAALADAESSSVGAEALGWYRLSGDGCGYAADWFHRAVTWSPDHKGTAKANEGLAQALARAGHDVEAADVADSWADRSADMKALDVKLMVELLTRDLFPKAVDEDRLGRFSILVREERSAAGAQALGWHRYRDAGAGYGVDWFADAIRWSPDQRADAKTVEGYASALRDVGRLTDAEEALFPWVDKAPLMRDLYIDTVVSELTRDNPPEPVPHDRLARFIAVATPLRSAAAAQALGWYRFARREYADAAIWFKYAVDWWPELPPDADRFTYVPDGYRSVLARLALKPEDYRRTPRAFTSRVHDPGVASHRYETTFGGLATTWTGYALTLRAVGRSDEAEDIAFRWRDRWPTLGRLFVDLAIEALTRQNGPAVDPARLKRYAAVIEEQRDAGGAAALGWAAAARHDPAESAVWLKAAIDWRPTDTALDAKVMAGYVDALRASGRAEEAYAAASAWADAVPELKLKLADVALDMLASAGRVTDGAAAVSPDRLAQAVTLAEADTGPRGPAALGWYHLGGKRAAAALPFFKLAVTRASAAGAPDADASALPKAVEGFALTLRALGRDADALTFAEAWSAKVPALAALPGDIVADLLGRDVGKATLPPDLVGRLTATTLRVRSVQAAAAFGWYAYERRDWSHAAEWFADGITWSPDGRGPVKLVEGYAASLHNQCRFEEAERVALSRPDEDGDGRLRTIYVDSVADRVARIKAGTALAPADAARLASTTMAISSGNGAQALGWYAYRSRQFATAAAWLEKALTWRATEAEAYGLALSYRRLGDAANLSRVLSLYEARFASLSAVRRSGIGGREPPVPDFGDLSRRGCVGGQGAERADATGAIATQGPAVSLPHAPEGTAPMATTPSAFVATAVASSPADDLPTTFRSRPVVVAAVERREEPARPVSQPAPWAAPRAPHPRLTTPVIEAEPSASAPRVEIAARNAAPQAGSAAAALAAKDYARCLSILERRSSHTVADRETEGWCLLGADRPAEAAEAFRAAGSHSSGQAASDSALGETLSHLRQGDAGAAADSANRAPIAAEKRRELGLQILSQQIVNAYKADRWADALELLRRRSSFAPEPRDLTMMRGWSLYHLGDYPAARGAFTEADTLLSDSDSRGGLATVQNVTTNKAFR